MSKLSRYWKTKGIFHPFLSLINLVPKVLLNISKELVLLSLLSSKAEKPKPFSGFLQVFYNAGGLYIAYDFGEGLWLFCEWLL